MEVNVNIVAHKNSIDTSAPLWHHTMNNQKYTNLFVLNLQSFGDNEVSEATDYMCVESQAVFFFLENVLTIFNLSLLVALFCLNNKIHSSFLQW